jgi:hypothetical protein
MSQLKTHQLAYRQHELRCVSSNLEEAETMLSQFNENPPDSSKQAMLIEGRIKARIRQSEELLEQLDKRVTRLT